MASNEPPKKEDKGKGVLRKEALDARVTELSTSLQEMMADGETSGQESSANETSLTTRRTDPSQSALTDGLRLRESYCLLVRVVKDAVGLSERNVRLPAHAWNKDIAVDICESRIGCPAGTYKAQLLSDTEFLLRKRPTSRPEMNWQDANAIIRLISGLFLWCGVLVSLAAGHHSKKEARYDPLPKDSLKQAKPVPPMWSDSLTFPRTLFRTRACLERTRRMLTTKVITSE